MANATRIEKRFDYLQGVHGMSSLARHETSTTQDATLCKQQHRKKQASAPICDRVPDFATFTWTHPPFAHHAQTA
jgi:hypothetical protein